jgi:dTMP kinase
MKAPLIVLEGLDACGKSTQTELLLENLKHKKLNVAWKRFPGYTVTTAGKRIAAYLRGELGNMESLAPDMIAALYASDRLAQLQEIEDMRDENDIVIFDRGVTSNLIYTAARHEKPSEVKKAIEYVEKLEYDVFGFPRESLVIFLDASFEARKEIHKAKNRLPDLHESNENYLKKVREVALQQCKDNFRWVNVPVDRFGELRRREDIAQDILNLVLEKLQMAKES